MSNIYFPDEEVTYNDLYFVCYMIERTARAIKQPNRYVVERLGKDGLARQLSIASTNHSLNPEQVVSDWKEEYQLENGTTDVTCVDNRFTDTVPSATQMGKVYARLIDIGFLQKVCHDWVYAVAVPVLQKKQTVAEIGICSRCGD